MSQRYDYQRFASWISVARGFPRLQAEEDAGWELVAILPQTILGGTLSYIFVMRRPAAPDA